MGQKENDKIPNSPRTFRISDDVYEKFRAFAVEANATSDQMLSIMVAAYETEQAKGAMPTRESEISEFQAELGKMLSMYIHSLQLYNGTEDRIASQYAERLSKKDALISDLQDREKAQIELATAANTAAMELENKNHQLIVDFAKEQKRADALQAAERDLRLFASAMEDRAKGAEKRAAKVDEIQKELNENRKKLEKDSSSLNAAMKEMEDLKQKHAEDMEQLNAKHESELTALRETMKHQEELFQVKLSAKEAELNALSKQYEAQLEAAIIRAKQGMPEENSEEKDTEKKIKK